MKTSDNGRLAIAIDQNGNPYVIFEPVNNTVWIQKAELPELFGVYQQKINTCLDSIFKTKALRPEEVSKYDFIVRGNSVGYDMQSFRLEVIIALAFYIDSLYAKVLREWFIRRCIHTGICDFPLSVEQNFSLN